MSNKMNKNKLTSRYIIMKFQNTENKKKILKPLEWGEKNYQKRPKMRMVINCSVATLDVRKKKKKRFIFKLGGK